jgi:bacterioferritin (cytochrome b1)
MNIVEILYQLLLDEYLQRDVYETYHYHLFGLESSPLQEHLAEHRVDEEKHIKVLQRYIMEFEAEPLTDRKEIPKLTPPLRNILKFNLDLEKAAVTNYANAIKQIEDQNDPELSALRIELENILVEEKEHVQDFLQWLRE